MEWQPQDEHQWLQRLVGEWTSETGTSMQPGEPLIKLSGKETVRSLGGFWILCEAEGEMPGGGTTHSLMTLGYDPVKKKYVGSFVASMMSHLWIYHEGELDASGKVLTLSAVGPSFNDDGTSANYHDMIEIQGADQRQLSAEVQSADGKWTSFMKVTYRRKTS